MHSTQDDLDTRHPRVMSPSTELSLPQGRLPRSSTAPLWNISLHEDVMQQLMNPRSASSIARFPTQRCPVCFDVIVGPCSQCLSCSASVHTSCARHSGGSSMYCLNCIEDAMIGSERELRRHQSQVNVACDLGAVLAVQPTRVGLSQDSRLEARPVP